MDFKLANFVLHLRLKVEYLQTKTKQNNVDFKLANFVLHLRLKVEYLQNKNKTKQCGFQTRQFCSSSKFKTKQNKRESMYTYTITEH